MGFFGKSKEEKANEFVNFLKENNIDARLRYFTPSDIRIYFSKEYDSFVLILGECDTEFLILNDRNIKTELFLNPDKFAKRYVNYEFPRTRYSMNIDECGDKKRKEVVLKLLQEIKKNFEIVCSKTEYKKYLEIKEKVEGGASWGVRPETSSGMRLYRLYARECIYDFHREEYDLPFEQYEVHHINGDTLDNDLRNLQIIKKEDHEKIHGRKW